MNEPPDSNGDTPVTSGNQTNSSASTFSTVVGAGTPSLSRRQLLSASVAGTALFGLSRPSGGTLLDGGTSAVGTAQAQSQTWTQQYTFDQPSADGGTYGTADPIEEFGAEVAISDDGDTAIVAAPGRENIADEGERGLVFMYTRDPDAAWVWNRRNRVTVDTPNDGFGTSVSISGSDEKTVVIGTPFECVPAEDDEDCLIEAGAAYVYTGSGDSWSQQGHLVAADATSDALFGSSVAASNDGDTVVIGAPIDEAEPGTEERRGAVYVFARDGETWTQQAKLPGPPDETSLPNSFGASVAVSNDGDTAVIGDPAADEVYGQEAGAAYVYTRTGEAWTMAASIFAEDGDEGDVFGDRVAISGDGTTAVITATRDENPNGEGAGAAYVFTMDGETWSQQAKLTPEDGDSDDQFGTDVAVTDAGDTAVIGASRDDDPNGQDSGSTYVFSQDGDGWSQQTKFAPSSNEGSELFGASVGLSAAGDTAVIGAPTLTGFVSNAAYVYTPADDAAESDGSMSVSLSPSTITVETQTEVTVTVTDGSGSPVTGATVAIQDLLKEGTTDAEGTVVFSITASDAGEYLVSATADGFADADAALTITTDSDDGTDEATGSGSNASGPGFGIGSALVSLGSAGYLLQRRRADDGTEP